MRYTTIVILFLTSLLSSCGKSPLLNKLENNFQEVAGSASLNENFPHHSAEFSLSWPNPPSLDEMSSFDIKFTNPLNDNQSLNAFIWMPEMGHGSSPFEMVKINLSHFNFSEVAFIMPGLWVLHIELLENNQVVDEWQKSIVL